MNCYKFKLQGVFRNYHPSYHSHLHTLTSPVSNPKPESHTVPLSLSHTQTRFTLLRLQYYPQMVESHSWTTRRSSNPRFETSVDIPSTPTGQLRYGTSNNIFSSATSFVSPTILTALIIASCYFSNIGVLLLNKYLLSFYGYRYPIFLTLLHMISCTFYSLIAIRWFQIVPFQQILSRKQFLKIFALSVIFCFSVVCGNTSLRYLPVSFNQAIGATTPFFTAIFTFLITCKKESAEVYLAFDGRQSVEIGGARVVIDFRFGETAFDESVTVYGADGSHDLIAFQFVYRRECVFNNGG